MSYIPLNFSRRNFLGAGAAAGFIGGSALSAEQPNVEQIKIDTTHKAVTIGRVKQSVMGWCFKPMPTPELIEHARRVGLVAIEGIEREHYAAARQAGLQIALVGSHGYKDGPLDTEHHPMVEAKLREAIDVAVANNSPNVITFTGFQSPGISDRQAKENCLRCWKKVIGYAEEKQVTLVLEHLNSIDDSHPLKGHPGYWGDQLDRCADLIKAMDSPRFKLLFDCYHVQIMHGDLIRNIRRYASITAHYHTAGNPGRCELDGTQEINYPPVIRAIMDTGYQGYIAQEFIPTWQDPVAAMWHAAKVCDV